MRIPRAILGLTGGAAAAAVAALALPAPDADARAGRNNKGGPLKLVDINVGGSGFVFQNEVIEMRFTQAVDPATVNPAVVQVWAENDTSTGFTKQVFGSYQVVGSVIRFYPRLPTHLRDPITKDFYPAGTAKDDAEDNAGFQPETNHQILIAGSPAYSAVRSTKGRPLNRTYRERFTTSPANPKTDAFTERTYTESGLPGFEFSNPSDKVPTPEDHYARHGGTRDVHSDIDVKLYGRKIPLSPATIRQGSNVDLTLLSRNDDAKFRKPVAGTPFIEQNYETVSLVFKPRFPLPDQGTYAMRVSNNVKDLTEVLDFEANAARLLLREVYEFMDAARDNAPGTPYEELPPPGPDLMARAKWPADEPTRDILQRNILDLGDNYPDEVDPRVMVMFTTRDEPISNAAVQIDFVKSDGYFDPTRSTASWDSGAECFEAACGIFTVAGGTAANGDFKPAANVQVNTDNYPQNTVNWRKLNIPPGVVVTITGSRPATIKALEMIIEGEIRADGFPGTDSKASSTEYLWTSWSQFAGGPGGPGGGTGGKSARTTVSPPAPEVPGRGFTGNPGHDANGTTASPTDGGQGGQGGSIGTGYTQNGYGLGGGGGGGAGMRTDGQKGSNPTFPSYASWNGAGGAGGKAALGNSDLDPLVGGAGGGAGGSGTYYYYSTSWGKTGGGGGGGGGALLLQTSNIFTMGTNAVVRTRGGAGGKGSNSGSYTMSAGPGGAGGGGSILVRSTRGFNIADYGRAFDVAGGVGGTQTGSYVALTGGAGGSGLVRTEDPNGGVSIPAGTAGTYDPVGAGPPSYVYSNWIDLGVDGPRVVNPTVTDFNLNAGNDAIFVEMQMAIEDTTKFGSPLTRAVDANEDSTNPAEVSQWVPLRVADGTAKPGGAFAIPGWNPASDGYDHIFDIASKLNGKNYKFFRLRIRFQLDDTQTQASAVPFVDQFIVRFQFNF